MATVNFSVPDHLKEAFNEAFADQNKSAIIAALMQRAIDEAERDHRRREAFRQLTQRRDARPAATGEQVRASRRKGRV